MTADEARRFESIVLFEKRARSASPEFAVTDENAADIAEISARLDGLPLAIEFAAARAKILSPAEILAKLDDRLSLLTGGAKDLPDRQRTYAVRSNGATTCLPKPKKMSFAAFQSSRADLRIQRPKRYYCGDRRRRR